MDLALLVCVCERASESAREIARESEKEREYLCAYLSLCLLTRRHAALANKPTNTLKHALCHTSIRTKVELCLCSGEACCIGSRPAP